MKSVRVAAGKAGSVLDKEDRRVLGMALVVASAILGSAGLLGLAIALFRYTASLG